MSFSIKNTKRSALTALKGNWGKAVGLTILVFLISAILPSVIEMFLSGGFSVWISETEPSVGAVIFNILFSIIIIPLTITVYWFYLELLREKNPDISYVFQIYGEIKTALKLVGLSIMQAIFLFLWTLLLVIPGIVKSFAYSQSYFILKDHPEYSVFEAITESRKRMVGYKWKFFLLNLSFIGWGILALITLGIGFLWLTPYITTSLAAFYENYIADSDKADEILSV